jgi:hypothetical protein
MDEPIGRLATELGVDRSTAQMAVGIALDFISTERPPDKIKLLPARRPGADALTQTANAGGSGIGAVTGGARGAGIAVMGAALSVGEVQNFTRQFIAFARDKVGGDAVDESVVAISGLSQFV